MIKCPRYLTLFLTSGLFLNNLKSVICAVSYAHRSLSELEGLRVGGDMGEKIRQVTERATLFRITSNAMINVKLSKMIKLPSKAFFADSLAYISPVFVCTPRHVETFCPWPRTTVNAGRKPYRLNETRGYGWRRPWSSWPNNTIIWKELSEELQSSLPHSAIQP